MADIIQIITGEEERLLCINKERHHSCHQKQWDAGDCTVNHSQTYHAGKTKTKNKNEIKQICVNRTSSVYRLGAVPIGLYVATVATVLVH